MGYPLGVFEKDAKEIERRWIGKSIKMVQRLQEKNWVTLVGFNEKGKES